MSDSQNTPLNRSDNRANDTLRPVTFERQFTRYAAGSVLISMGNTRVLCTASVENKVPPFLRDSGQGWVTAEYGMLPGATHTRGRREAARGKQSGRTQEIQRLIGRSLRAAVDLNALGERTIQLDCDVLQADGGTRCAAITGAWVALADAVDHLIATGELTESPITDTVAAISVGTRDGQALLDLDYAEDVSCDADVNVVMTGTGDLVEVQATAEGHTFNRKLFDEVLDVAGKGIEELIAHMQAARKTPLPAKD